MATDASLADGTRRYAPDPHGEQDTLDRRLAAVATALERFSRDFPRVVAQELGEHPVDTADQTKIPGGWDRKWSKVLRVEWPYLTKTNGLLTPSLHWLPGKSPAEVGREKAMPKAEVRDDEDGKLKLRLPGVAISATQPALVSYTRKYEAATLPEMWEKPVEILGAAYYARALAGVYEAGVDAEPGGLSILATGDVADNYRELADMLFSMYRDYMIAAGITVPDGDRAAEVVASNEGQN